MSKTASLLQGVNFQLPLGGHFYTAGNNDNSLWLAKFPSRHDDYDIGLWEFIVYQMAIEAGIKMAESKVEAIGTHHIF